MNITARRRRSTPSYDKQVGARNWIKKHFKLAVDLDRLTDGEKLELIAIIDEAVTTGGGANTVVLDRHRRRWETLLEKGAALPSGEFKRRRDLATVEHEARAATRLARRPRVPFEAETRSYFGELFGHLRDGYIDTDHLVALTLIASQLLSAQPLAPHATIEGQGAQIVLVVDRNYGLINGDRDTVDWSWRRALPHLATNGWIVVEDRRSRIAIGFGPRLIRLLDLGNA